MPETLPNSAQPDSAYYENYRRSLIQRHIAKNGRFLTTVMLVEEDTSKSPPNAAFHSIRRYSKEKLFDGEADYTYSAYPVVIHDPALVDTQWYPEADYVVGGGDNPLLHGGLAMATFSLEELLDVSEYSFEYASRLLDYFLDSEITTAGGQPSGFPLRRRQWWHTQKEISKDELCGLLLGMHFFLKAAAKRGDSHQLVRATEYLKRMGRYLKARDYGPAGAWIFQFPFTRVFKFGVGTPYLSGTTFPDNWPLFADEIVGFLASIYSLFSLDFDFRYRPRDLYRDSLEWLPELYEGALDLSILPLLEVDENFFNVAMYLHTMLMIHDNPVKQEVRDNLWSAFRRVFDFFCRTPPIEDALGRGDAMQNAYFGIVAHAFAKTVNRGNEVRDRAKEMYATVIRPSGIWKHDLPLSDLFRSTELDLPGVAQPFMPPFPEGGNPLETAEWHSKIRQEKRGEWFTWEHSDRYKGRGHVFYWDWARTLRDIGTTEEKRGLLTHVSDGATPGLVQAKYYHARPDLGFRVEAAGLDLLFTRVLAAHYGLAPKPELQNDLRFDVVPLDGPPAKGGFVANIRKREVHDYLNRKRQCQIQEIRRQRWFRDLKAAHDEGFDNCARCIGGSKR